MVWLRTSVVTVFVSASLVALLVAGASVPSAGCATQETEPTPDAAPAPCQIGPHIFCAPAPPNTSSCSTDDGSSDLLTRLPRATSYPLGCVINFVGERDPQGDCHNDGICKCEVDEAPPPAPLPDGGGGGSPTIGAPHWNCAS
jgi:hypothetical protein